MSTIKQNNEKQIKNNKTVATKVCLPTIHETLTKFLLMKRKSVCEVYKKTKRRKYINQTILRNMIFIVENGIRPNSIDENTWNDRKSMLAKNDCCVLPNCDLTEFNKELFEIITK